jgi:hypothetical protein
LRNILNKKPKPAVILLVQVMLCLAIWNPSITVLRSEAEVKTENESSARLLMPADFVRDILHKLAPKADAERLAQFKDRTEPLTDVQLRQLLEAVGFEGKSLKTAWAIAKAESNGRPLAWNKNALSGDNSMGVFQINMIGDLGADRVKKFNLDHPRELLDPVTNAAITYYMSKAGTNWSAWSTYGGNRAAEWAAKFPSSPGQCAVDKQAKKV